MASRQSVHLQFVRSRYGQATRTAVYHAISPMISVAPCSYLTNLLTHHRRHDARLMSSWHILRSPSLLSGSQLSRLTIPCASSIWSAHSHPRHTRHGQLIHHAHGNHHHPSIRERLRHSRLQYLAEVDPHLPSTAQRLYGRQHFTSWESCTLASQHVKSWLKERHRWNGKGCRQLSTLNC